MEIRANSSFNFITEVDLLDVVISYNYLHSLTSENKIHAEEQSNV